MINDNQNTCLNCPFSWENFDNLTDEELNLINKNRSEARFKSGEIIFKQGSPTSNAIFISQGLAKIYMEGYDGKNIILSIVSSGRLIAGPGVYVDNKHHYSLAALTNVTVCFVDISVLKSLVHKNSMFAEGYLKDISHKSLGNFNKLLSFTQKKMHGRLAEGIVYLSEHVFNSTSFKCWLSRQEFGEFTGMTKESVVRLFKEFHDDGILNIDNDSIDILDMPKLKKIMISG